MLVRKFGMLVLKFVLGTTIAGMMVVYQYWPGESTAVPEDTLISREAAVYALFAASFFLVCYVADRRATLI